MKVVILALLLTLVGCQQQEQQIPANAVSYDYEYQILNRLQKEGFASAGIKVKCKLVIGNIGPDRKILLAHSFEGFDYNGIFPKQHFIQCPRLTEIYKAQIKDAITFKYKNGRVTDLMAPDQVSTFALNFYKGILNLLDYNLKANQTYYVSRENGTEGECNTTYIIQNSKKASPIFMTKFKDLTKCDNMALKVVGASYAVPCEECQKTIQASVLTNYQINDAQKGEKERLIMQADSWEIRQFTPFNALNGGSVKMEARQSLIYTDSQADLPLVPSNLKKCGPLLHNITKENPLLPVKLPKSKDYEREIREGLEYLAEHPDEKFPDNGGIRFLQLVQLLRTTEEKNYFDSFFQQYSSKPTYKRLIMDLAATVGNADALKFIRRKMERQEISSIEATQTLLVFFHFCNASQEVVEEAMIIATEVLKGPSSLYRTSILLAYSSLLNRYCSASLTCPEKHLKLLIDFANKAVRESDVEGMILVLKCFGNVGQPVLWKPIRKFISNAASSLDIRVQYNALLALRNMAKKDPRRVQEILLPVVMDHALNPTVRVHAAMCLLESNPPLGILMNLAEAMLKEPSKQVQNFIYTTLKAMARFTGPEFRRIASDCRQAFSILDGKIKPSAGHRYSRTLAFQIFRESLMAGATAKLVFIHKEGSMIPTFAMTRFRATFLGYTIFPLEVGIGTQGLPNLLEKIHEAGKGGSWDPDTKQLQDMLSDQKIPHDTPIVGAYLKIFDQEIIHGKMKLDTIQEIFQVYQGKTDVSSVQEFMDVLRNHKTLQWEKNFMSAEVHLLALTCTGLPWQISLAHVSHTKLAGSVQLSMTPEPKSQLTLPDMLNAEIKLQTKGKLSILKDMLLTVGVVTPEIQAVLEANARLTVNLPVDVDIIVNIKEKTFHIELPPCEKETDIVSLSFHTSAITYNIEETLAKSTPLLLPQSMSNIMKEAFDSRPLKQDEIEDTIIESAEAQSQRHSDSVQTTMCFETCTFGCEACVKWSNAYSGCMLGDSLYNIVGEHTLKLTLRQNDQKAPIEKLRFTLQGGAQDRVVVLRDEEKKLRIKHIQKASFEDAKWGQLKEEDEEQDRDTRSSERSSSESDRSSSSGSSSDSRKSWKRDKLRLHIMQKGSGQSKQPQRPDIKNDEKQQDKYNWNSSHTEDSSSSSSSSKSRGSSSSSSSSHSSSSSSSSSGSGRRHRHHSSSSSSSSDSRWSQEIQTQGQTFLPYFTIIAEALRTDKRVQGYNFSMYMNHDISKLHLKMIATELARPKWRACFERIVTPFKVWNKLSWGNKCQDYKIELKAVLGQVVKHAALQMNLTWSKLPGFIVKRASWAMDFLHGVAYVSGFSSVYEENSSHKLMLRIIATSPYTHAVIFKVPGETFYKDAFCAPFVLPNFTVPYYEKSLPNTLNILDLASWIAQGDQAVCEVGEDTIVTFDDKVFNTTLRNQNCDLLVVQDCNKNANYNPQFRLWTRKCDCDGHSREILLNITNVWIKILPSLDTLIVLYNEQAVLADKSLFVDVRASIKIYRNETTVVIEAPQHGLANVTYDGSLLRVTVTSMMKGNTCGLCGDNNGELRNERQMPNRKLALSDMDFFKSWSLTGSCAAETRTTLSESEKTLAS